nr:transposase zinc-binding domain-containing protein [Novosphingobium sp. 9]
MFAIKTCQGFVHWRVSYNSCRNRHCPKCQAVAARSCAEHSPYAGKLAFSDP